MILMSRGNAINRRALALSRAARQALGTEQHFAAGDAMEGWNGRDTPEPGPHTMDGWFGRDNGRTISNEAIDVTRSGSEGDLVEAEIAVRCSNKLKDMLGPVNEPKPAPQHPIKQKVNRAIARGIARAAIDAGAANMRDADDERQFAAESKSAEIATEGMDREACLAALNVNEKLRAFT